MKIPESSRTKTQAGNIHYLSVVCAASLLGTSGLFVKTFQSPMLVVAGFRTFIPLFFLLAFHRREVFSKFKPSRVMVLASFFTALRICLWIVAMTYASITKSVIVLYLWPMFLAIFSAVFLKQHLGKRRMCLLTIAFSGLLILYGHKMPTFEDRESLGLLAMLGVALINAAVLLVFQTTLKQRNQYQVLFYDNAIGACIFGPILLFHLFDLQSGELARGILYGLVVGYLGYTCLFFGLRRVPAVSAAILSYVEALVACAIGIFFFGEPVGWRLFVGGAMILSSAALIRDYPNRPAKFSAEPAIG